MHIRHIRLSFLILLFVTSLIYSIDLWENGDIFCYRHAVAVIEKRKPWINTLPILSSAKLLVKRIWSMIKFHICQRLFIFLFATDTNIMLNE